MLPLGQGNVITTATAATMMLLMNLTGGQIAAGLTPEQKKFLQSSYVRWIAIYAIFFVGTRDIYLTAVLGTCAVLLMEFLLNEHSRYYLFRRVNDGIHTSVGSDALNVWNY